MEVLLSIRNYFYIWIMRPRK